jgi:hypothetical protein
MEELQINLTPTMIAVGMLVSLVLEFIKAITSRWSWLTDTITKPAFPLLACGLCMGIFTWSGSADPLLNGIAVGLMTAGGYDTFKAMAAAKAPKVLQ